MLAPFFIRQLSADAGFSLLGFQPTVTLDSFYDSLLGCGYQPNFVKQRLPVRFDQYGCLDHYGIPFAGCPQMFDHLTHAHEHFWMYYRVKPLQRVGIRENYRTELPAINGAIGCTDRT